MSVRLMHSALKTSLAAIFWAMKFVWFCIPQYLTNPWYKLILLSFYCEKRYMV